MAKQPYQVEYLPNPNYIHIHLKQAIGQPGSLADVMGVDHAEVFKYHIWLCKGTLFTWDEVLPAVVRELETILLCELEPMPPIFPPGEGSLMAASINLMNAKKNNL